MALEYVIDVESTGLTEDDRIVELGAVEIVDRKITGRVFQSYVNPECSVDREAFEVHGLSDEFLRDKPLFSVAGREFLNFIKGGVVVAHNAGFDVGFIDREIALAGGTTRLATFCEGIIDTVPLARSVFPGQRNSLDALCKRYKIDLKGRELHGALHDCQLLAMVYLLLTQTQNALSLSEQDSGAEHLPAFNPAEYPPLVVTSLTENQLSEHNAYLKRLNSACEQGHVDW